jgi:plasmid stabilization system protein ParE
VQELKEIKTHIEEKLFSKQSAQELASKIMNDLQFLKTAPELGINFDERIGRQLTKKHTLRMYIIDKKHLIFYVALPKQIYVLHIVNTKTDYLNRLNYISKIISWSNGK